MTSQQSSLEPLTGGECREDEASLQIDKFTRSLRGLGSEGFSEVSSESPSGDSTASKRLGSAESASSGDFNTTPSIVGV